MTKSPCRPLPLALLACAAVGLAALGCQSTAVVMDDPWTYDQAATLPASLNAYCASAVRDAVVWGTSPSAWCAPYSLYWLQPGGVAPSVYYGRPAGRPWRGPGWYRGYSGRGFGGWRGGWRGSRGGRR